MSTSSPKPLPLQDSDRDDQERLRAYLNSSEWQDRLQEAARQRLRATSDGGTTRDNERTEAPGHDKAPSGDAKPESAAGPESIGNERPALGYTRASTDAPVRYAASGAEARAAKPVNSITRMEQARAAREQALARRNSDDPAAAGVAVPKSGPPDIETPKPAPLPEPVTLPSVYADTGPTGSSGQSPAGVLRTLGGWSAGVGAGVAACLLGGVVLYGALGLRTDPVATVSPDVAQNLADIELAAERLARGPRPVTLPRPPGGAAPDDGVVARVAAVAWLPPPPSRAADPASVVDLKDIRPDTVQTLAGLPPPSVGGDPAPAVDVVTPPRDMTPRDIAALSALPDSVAADPVPRFRPDPPAIAGVAAPAPVLALPSPVAALRRIAPDASGPPRGLASPQGVPAVVESPALAMRADPSAPAIPSAMVSFRSRLDPPGAIRLAALSGAQREESGRLPGEVVAPNPPRVDRIEPAGWTEPGTTIPGRMRAILTHSGGVGADVARLRRLGVAVAEVQVTRFAVAITRVHYFHGEDAGPARKLAADLGGEAIDLTGFAPGPPRGTFEIQLAD